MYSGSGHRLLSFHPGSKSQKQNNQRDEEIPLTDTLSKQIVLIVFNSLAQLRGHMGPCLPPPPPPPLIGEYKEGRGLVYATSHKLPLTMTI